VFHTGDDTERPVSQMEPIVFNMTDRDDPSSSAPTSVLVNNRPGAQFTGASSTLTQTYWLGRLPPNYAGQTIKVRVYWAATSSGTGNVTWFVGFERYASGLALGSSSWGTQNFVVAAASGTANSLQLSDLTFTSSAMDSLVGNEVFRMFLKRDTSDGSDTYGAAANVFAVEILEV
jgi:hypothetical protein